MFFIFFSIVLIFYTFKNLYNIERILLINIEKLSSTFGYNLQFYDIVGLNYVNETDILNIIEPYKETSIFLLPLKKISNSIFENTWVKNVIIKTNYKNKLNINL